MAHVESSYMTTKRWDPVCSKPYDIYLFSFALSVFENITLYTNRLGVYDSTPLTRNSVDCSSRHLPVSRGSRRGNACLNGYEKSLLVRKNVGLKSCWLISLKKRAYLGIHTLLTMMYKKFCIFAVQGI